MNMHATKSGVLLFDTGRNEQLLTLYHILQLTQVAHIVDLPAKLETTDRTERGFSERGESARFCFNVGRHVCWCCCSIL